MLNLGIDILFRRWNFTAEFQWMWRFTSETEWRWNFTSERDQMQHQCIGPWPFRGLGQRPIAPGGTRMSWPCVVLASMFSWAWWPEQPCVSLSEKVWGSPLLPIQLRGERDGYPAQHGGAFWDVQLQTCWQHLSRMALATLPTQMVTHSQTAADGQPFWPFSHANVPVTSAFGLCATLIEWMWNFRDWVKVTFSQSLSALLSIWVLKTQTWFIFHYKDIGRPRSG